MFVVIIFVKVYILYFEMFYLGGCGYDFILFERDSLDQEMTYMAFSHCYTCREN